MAKKKLTIDDVLVPKEEIPYEVPENWCWVKLGTVIKVSSGKNLTKTKMNQDGNIPVYGGNGFVGYHNDFNVDESKIIIGRVGANCGNVHITDNKAWITDNAFIVSYDENLFNKEYLYYLLSECDLGKYSNSSAQPVISGQKIYDVAIQIPPLAKQERIVNRIESLFDKVDKAAGLVDEAREGFDSRKTSILQKGFKGEFIGKEYTELVNLGELITDVSSGFACGKQNEISKDEDGAYPHFRPNNVGFYNQFNYDKIVYIPQEKVQKGKGTLSKGDIIFNNTNSTELVGRAVVVRDDMDTAFSNHLTRIRVDESRVIPKWVAYCINTLWKQGHFASICKQWVGQSGVNQDVLKNEVAIPVPPIDEQRKIVDILDKLLEKEFEIEDSSKIDRSIDVIKKSILAKAFRGELGSNDLNEESSIELLKNLIK